MLEFQGVNFFPSNIQVLEYFKSNEMTRMQHSKVRDFSHLAEYFNSDEIHD